MQNYNTIIGVIQMRQNNCSYSVIQNRYHIGSGTVQLILKGFESSGFSLEDLKSKEPSQVEEFFYPPDNHRQKDIPLPDFALYFDRIHSKGSKVNIAYCWLEYKQQHRMDTNNPNFMNSTTAM